MKGVYSRYPLPPDMLIDYILARIEPVSSWSACWIWKGARKANGYGALGGGYKGQTRIAHRRVYEAAIGPIPDGLTLDHLCGRKLCVNPLHLEPVTLEENVRRANRQRNGYCRRGLHELIGENIRTSTLANGRTGRGCRACDRANKAARRRAKDTMTTKGTTPKSTTPKWDVREAYRRRHEVQGAKWLT